MAAPTHENNNNNNKLTKRKIVSTMTTTTTTLTMDSATGLKEVYSNVHARLMPMALILTQFPLVNAIYTIMDKVGDREHLQEPMLFLRSNCTGVEIKLGESAE